MIRNQKCPAPRCWETVLFLGILLMLLTSVSTAGQRGVQLPFTLLRGGKQLQLVIELRRK